MDSLNLISVINWKPVSCLSRGSDGEKRGALSTTRARQLSLSGNLTGKCLESLCR